MIVDQSPTHDQDHNFKEKLTGCPVAQNEANRNLFSIFHLIRDRRFPCNVSMHQLQFNAVFQQSAFRAPSTQFNLTGFSNDKRIFKVLCIAVVHHVDTR